MPNQSVSIFIKSSKVDAVVGVPICFVRKYISCVKLVFVMLINYILRVDFSHFRFDSEYVAINHITDRNLPS